MEKTPPDAVRARPKIVTLCGSTRFRQEFIDANERLSHAGVIVLSVCEACLLRRPADGSQGKEQMLGEDVARLLDATYLHKIAMSDEIFVLNVGGYIGASTAKEIAHAQKLGKPITYLEPVGAASSGTPDAPRAVTVSDDELDALKIVSYHFGLLQGIAMPGSPLARFRSVLERFEAGSASSGPEAATRGRDGG